MIRTKEYNLPDFGNVTEDVVLRELNRLSSTFHIFTDVYLRLNRPVRYKNTKKKIKFCQIDFVVVGLTGIFIIEAKEWNEKILKEDKLLPLMEVDKAGLIFYIRSLNFFGRKFPIYNIAVMLTKVPKVKYGFVRHLTISELYWFILRRDGVISKKKIKQIVRWLTKISNRKDIKR